MTNEKAPERIWIDAAPHLIADATRHIYVEPPPPHFRNFNSIEYVRADLLVTVRGEEREAAWRDAIKITKAQLTSEDSDSNIGINRVIIALEAENRKEEG